MLLVAGRVLDIYERRTRLIRRLNVRGGRYSCGLAGPWSGMDRLDSGMAGSVCMRRALIVAAFHA